MDQDVHLKESVLQRLKDHPRIDTSHMEVLVKDRVVTLKGKADTEEEKKWAEETAVSTPGVSGVKNELHVGSGLLYSITQLASGIAASNDHELHKDKPAGEIDEKSDDSNG